MPPWARNRRCLDVDHAKLAGEWVVVTEEGTCQRCLVPRRLYSPVAFLELAICAPCSEIQSISSISSIERECECEDEESRELTELENETDHKTEAA
jgi:hypothetical protein